MRAQASSRGDWYREDVRRGSRVVRWLKRTLLAAGFSVMLNAWFLHLLLNGRCF
jgi:hypothetical protein